MRGADRDPPDDERATGSGIVEEMPWQAAVIATRTAGADTFAAAAPWDNGGIHWGLVLPCKEHWPEPGVLGESGGDASALGLGAGGLGLGGNTRFCAGGGGTMITGYMNCAPAGAAPPRASASPPAKRKTLALIMSFLRSRPPRGCPCFARPPFNPRNVHLSICQCELPHGAIAPTRRGAFGPRCN
jgi:hypothetical protein